MTDLTPEQIDQAALDAGYDPDDSYGRRFGLQQGRHHAAQLLAHGIHPDRLTAALRACRHVGVRHVGEGWAVAVARILAIAAPETQKEDQ